MLKRLWAGWMRLAVVIGNFNSRVVLTVFYTVIVFPFGLVMRLFGDPLAIRQRRDSSWTPIQNPTRSIADGRRQF